MPAPRPDYLPPAAWLGYGLDLARGGVGLYMRVCSYHEPAEVAKARRWCGELPISDGACPECAQRLMDSVTGEKIDA
jgi:hypothetical protein